MRKKIERGWKIFMAIWLLLGNNGVLMAQVQSASTDSIDVISLMEQVEKSTSYKIYTDISKPFMVKKQDGEVSLEQLENALEGTLWRVNVYGNRVFVIRNLNLQDTLLKTI